MQFGNLNLQDENIITSSVQYRSMPNRNINTFAISRREGLKYISDDFTSKEIVISGNVITTSASGLIAIIDKMQSILAIPEQALFIDDNRSYTATCSKAIFPEISHNRTISPFELTFLCSNPFAYGNNLIAGFKIPSGQSSYDFTTTISGAAFIEPLLRLTYSGVGPLNVNSQKFSHLTKGAEVTISGSFSRGNDTVLSYENATVTNSGLLIDYTGSFSKWNVGENTLRIEFNTNTDIDIQGFLEYSPRFYF